MDKYQELENLIRRNNYEGFVAALAKLNAPDGTVPAYQLLEVAHNYGRERMVAHLLAQGFSPVNTEYSYSLVLFQNLENKNSKILTQLLATNDINQRNLVGMTPLIYAAYLENIPALDILLPQPGLEINAIDRYGMTALTYCCLNGNARAAQKLLAQKIKIQSWGNQHDDIYYAVLKNNPDVLQLLLDTGIDVNLGHRPGGASLIINAAQAAGLPVLEKLINQAADINYINEHGQAPLLAAAKRYDGWQYDITELLISHGANINITAPNGETVRSIARHKNDRPLLEIIDRHTSSAPPAAPERVQAPSPEREIEPPAPGPTR